MILFYSLQGGRVGSELVSLGHRVKRCTYEYVYTPFIFAVRPVGRLAAPLNSVDGIAPSLILGYARQALGYWRDDIVSRSS